jgi:hypothetical protein
MRISRELKEILVELIEFLSGTEKEGDWYSDEDDVTVTAKRLSVAEVVVVSVWQCGEVARIYLNSDLDSEIELTEEIGYQTSAKDIALKIERLVK